MRRIYNHYKEGAASFYIVAFSTLILVIIVASFIAVVLSQLTRTANDDLSQSAYDSALAGIEDAKVAFYNYQKCANVAPTTPNNDGKITCGEIRYWMRNPDCDMVGHILGRIPESTKSEVLIEENSNSSGGSSNNMQQAYTCTTIDTELSDYRSTLTESDTTQVVRVRLGNGVQASQIVKVKISWYSNDDARSTSRSNFSFTNFESGKVSFPHLKTSGIAVPPTISVGLVQTSSNFSLDQFEQTTSSATNRGTVFLVPTNNASWASGQKGDNYVGVYSGGKNTVSASRLVKSNNRAVKNLPLAVYCPGNNGSEFACSAEIELPSAIGGSRSNETFMFVVSVPYARPSTSFSLEFYCREGANCGTETVAGETTNTNRATLSGMQIKIDSTGRANNLYRRIEARMDTSDSFYPFPLYALEVLDDNAGEQSLISKPISECEYTSTFGGPTC